MKTTILSVHPLMIAIVLNELESHINYKYLGEDHQGKILLEVKYENDKENIIWKISKYMKEREEILRDLTKEIDAYFIKAKNKYDELAEMFKDVRKWSKQSNKLKTSIKN